MYITGVFVFVFVFVCRSLAFASLLHQEQSLFEAMKADLSFLFRRRASNSR